MSKDIFDLNNVGDLPEELKNQLIGRKKCHYIELFSSAGRPLAINEIMVGLYREFGLVKSRAQATGKLYNLAKRGIVVKVNGSPVKYRLK